MAKKTAPLRNRACTPAAPLLMLAALLLLASSANAATVLLQSPADNTNVTKTFAPTSETFIFSYVADPGDPPRMDCTLYFDGAPSGTLNLHSATSGVITLNNIAFGTHSWMVECGGFAAASGPFYSPKYTYIVTQRSSNFYCNTSGITATLLMGGAGFLGLLLIAALAYMAGEALHEPRFTEWAKTEPGEVAMSVVLLMVAVLFVQVLCSIDMWEFAKWTGQESGPSASRVIAQGDSPFSAAVKYLTWGARETQITMTAIRAQMGAYNQQATLSEFTSSGGLGAIGESSSPNAGDYSLSGVLGSLLNMNTMFLLAIYFQYYSLLLFSSGNGVFMALLPLGFVLRCVPTMRGVGGAVASLALALYLMYPLMLAIYSLVLPPIYTNYDAGVMLGSPTNPMSLGDVQAHELSIEGNWLNALWRTPPQIGNMGLFFQLTVFNFLRAVFFPTAGLLLIAALARELSKLFGDEIDASRLVQMI